MAKTVDDNMVVFLGAKRYKSGWENVSPAEVEAYLRNMAGTDAAVVSYPDQRQLSTGSLYHTKRGSYFGS